MSRASDKMLTPQRAGKEMEAKTPLSGNFHVFVEVMKGTLG